MKKLLLILFLLNFGSSYAQEEIIEPSRFITRLGFVQFTGGVVMFQARLEPFTDTLNFILDTGSGGISLDSSTASRFGLEGTPSNRVIRGIAGVRNVNFLYDRTLVMPGLRIDSLDFHINDYSILTAVYGEKIDGIVGYSVLSRYIVKVNYDSSRMELWSKGGIDYPRAGYLLRPTINALPVQGLRVKDGETVHARFLYDMGAGLNLMLSSDFLEDSALLHRKRKLYPKQAEGLGGKVDIFLTVIREVKLGPYRFKKVPVYIFDDVYNITSYPSLGGILGNDILRRFNVILNYGKQEIHLLPNSHYDEPFDYSYSGLELYQIDGMIIIGDVAKGSPADKAGLKEEDVVVAVNNSFSQNLQQYKAAIQAAGQRLRIIIQREGELLEFDFKISSILR